MKTDPNVEEVRRVREELVKRYGGLDGWIDHLQEMDKARARRTKKSSVNLAKPSKGRVGKRASRKRVAVGGKG